MIISTLPEPGRQAVACARRVATATPHDTEGKPMTYAKPSLKRLGSLAELTLTTASCEFAQV
jgi:hypothetical protein